MKWKQLQREHTLSFSVFSWAFSFRLLARNCLRLSCSSVDNSDRFVTVVKTPPKIYQQFTYAIVTKLSQTRQKISSVFNLPAPSILRKYAALKTSVNWCMMKELDRTRRLVESIHMAKKLLATSGGLCLTDIKLFAHLMLLLSLTLDYLIVENAALTLNYIVHFRRINNVDRRLRYVTHYIETQTRKPWGEQFVTANDTSLH